MSEANGPGNKPCDIHRCNSDGRFQFWDSDNGIENNYCLKHALLARPIELARQSLGGQRCST